MLSLWQSLNLFTPDSSKFKTDKYSKITTELGKIEKQTGISLKKTAKQRIKSWNTLISSRFHSGIQRVNLILARVSH